MLGVVKTTLIYTFELVSVVSVILSRSASFRSVGESLAEGRVFGSVIDVKLYYTLD